MYDFLKAYKNIVQNTANKYRGSTYKNRVRNSITVQVNLHISKSVGALRNYFLMYTLVITYLLQCENVSGILKKQNKKQNKTDPEHNSVQVLLVLFFLPSTLFGLCYPR